ncbi:hypothetical protein [Cyanobacterium sp. Dongsha4]|uniref:hypothetical protein n=1 Tax=Cyanobacterium sp. DS4 TaxID=2878255 RepID=UPI002E812491|nr:hypothetical protein [Cyanobacterium sp. Dongsha4]WVL00002.1 hypothetical protein Dongsha4_15245 [Cyanobacterium sp. Dongsha4]
MKITRNSIVDKFSTFVFFPDENNNFFCWQTDLLLKRNIETSITEKQKQSCEKIARSFLSSILNKHDKIKQNHLSAYLQETCLWSARIIYERLCLTLKLLTLEECFSSGNLALIQPEKLLKNYQVKYRTKITTYAQTRLNTIIKDTIYRNRQWKLLSDWGLLTKIGIKRAESILTIQGGLKDNKLQEYLLAWQCYLDNYQTCGIRKHKVLSEPNSTHLQLMVQQYNLQIKQLNQTPITPDELKQKLKFCIEMARLATNPITVMYEENDHSLIEENSNNYIDDLAIEKESQEIKSIIINSFQNQDSVNQAILYFIFSLNLTQGEIITIINQTHPDFIKQQYQLSRKINSIKKSIIDEIIKIKNLPQNQTSAKEIKPLISLLDVCIQEYIEDEIFILIEKCYQNLNSEQQKYLKQEYFKEINNSSKEKNSFKGNNQNLVDNIREKLANKLNIFIPQISIINSSINIQIQKFYEKYFNQIK